MNKKTIFLSLLLLLVGCSSQPSNSNTATPPSIPTSPSNPVTPPSTSDCETGDTGDISTSIPPISDSTDVTVTMNIAEINEYAATLEESQIGQKVTFNCVYLKKITDNTDKVMLVADDSDAYLYVRVSNGLWTTSMENNYLNYDYRITGNIMKYLGHTEIKFESLERLGTANIEIDLSKLTENKNSLGEVYDEFALLTLSNKYNGIGKIVTFDGKLIATDRSDANTKGVYYDGTNVITVINTTKVGTESDFGKTFRITGSLSVLKSSPAILLLKSEIINDEVSLNIDTNNIVNPSYFKKWNTLSDKMNPPSFSDYGVLYKTTGYVKSDDMNGKYYLGVVDDSNGSLSDNGVSTSISGVFLMNNLNMNDNDLSYSIFAPYFIDEIPVTFCFTLFQFETSWHGWKVMPIDSTVPVIEI